MQQVLEHMLAPEVGPNQAHSPTRVSQGRAVSLGALVTRARRRQVVPALMAAWLVACGGASQPRGVYRVADLARGRLSSSPSTLTSAGGLLYFTADDGLYGRELWRSDGTPAGTLPLDGTLAGSDAATFAPLGDNDGRLYFAAPRPVFMTVWRSDGTPAGTTPVPGPVLRAASRAIVFDRALFFAAGSRDVTRLWRSDGSPEGTYALAAPLAAPASLARLGQALYFLARPMAPHPQAGLDVDALWRSDGTDSGTTLVRAFSMPAFQRLSGLVAAGDALFFRGHDELHGYGLWSSDGTPAGTRFVSDVERDAILDLAPAQLTPFGARVAFTGDVLGGAQIWVSDGTAAGTVALLPRPLTLRAGLPDAGRPRELTPVAGRLFFSAEGALWRSDGTPAGTLRLREGLDAQELTAFEGGLVFVAGDAEYGRELWRSDGTPEGTRPLADVAPGPASSAPASLRALGDTLYFSADDGRAGRELWAYGPLPPASPTPTPRGVNQAPEIVELRVEPRRLSSRTVVFRVLDADGDSLRWSASVAREDGGASAGTLGCDPPCEGAAGAGPQLSGLARAGREVRLVWVALDAPPGRLSVTVTAVDELGAAAAPRQVTFTFGP